ncbi:hypothetical protein MBLNU459_g6922t2 [Dothideomycetes sp. NU459]
MHSAAGGAVQQRRGWMWQRGRVATWQRIAAAALSGGGGGGCSSGGPDGSDGDSDGSSDGSSDRDNSTNPLPQPQPQPSHLATHLALRAPHSACRTTLSTQSHWPSPRPHPRSPAHRRRRRPHPPIHLAVHANTAALDPEQDSIYTSRSFATHESRDSEKASIRTSRNSLDLVSSRPHVQPQPQTQTQNQAPAPAQVQEQHTQAPAAQDDGITACAVAAESQDPPPFSSHNFPSLYFPPPDSARLVARPCNEPAEPTEPLPLFSPSPSLSPFSPAPPFERSASSSVAAVVADTKAALPPDNKDPSSSKDLDDGEPPPPYTEGSSPLDGFTYVMAAAGGAASIITQVSQSGPAPINTLAGASDEHITLDLRGTRFTLSRDELLTLPEFVLLSLFPNGLLPDGHMNSYHDGDVYPVDVSRPAPPRSHHRVVAAAAPATVQALCNLLSNPNIYLSDMLYSSQYDPTSLQYMLEFFRNVAQTIPTASSPSDDQPSPFAGQHDAVPIEPMAGNARDMLQDRAGIIVLREDLDFYAIPPRRDIDQTDMIEVKRAAGRALLKQAGIFSGLRKSEEPGTTEQHLIEMLTAGGFNHDDKWGHRAGEPQKAVICSIALARLRTDVRGDMASNPNAVGMAQKLLLFWRKPARRCWWEGVDLENVEGVQGKLKVWIRRVWTLEMSVIGLR